MTRTTRSSDPTLDIDGLSLQRRVKHSISLLPANAHAEHESAHRTTVATVRRAIQAAAPGGWAERMWRRRYGWAIRSRLKPIKEGS